MRGILMSYIAGIGSNLGPAFTWTVAQLAWLGKHTISAWNALGGSDASGKIREFAVQTALKVTSFIFNTAWPMLRALYALVMANPAPWVGGVVVGGGIGVIVTYLCVRNISLARLGAFFDRCNLLLKAGRRVHF
jgi:hypothetical protein